MKIKAHDRHIRNTFIAILLFFWAGGSIVAWYTVKYIRQSQLLTQTQNAITSLDATLKNLNEKKQILETGEIGMHQQQCKEHVSTLTRCTKSDVSILKKQYQDLLDERDAEQTKNISNAIAENLQELENLQKTSSDLLAGMQHPLQQIESFDINQTANELKTEETNTIKVKQELEKSLQTKAFDLSLQKNVTKLNEKVEPRLKDIEAIYNLIKNTEKKLGETSLLINANTKRLLAINQKLAELPITKEKELEKIKRTFEKQRPEFERSLGKASTWKNGLLDKFLNLKKGKIQSLDNLENEILNLEKKNINVTSVRKDLEKLKDQYQEQEKKINDVSLSVQQLENTYTNNIQKTWDNIAKEMTRETILNVEQKIQLYQKAINTMETIKTSTFQLNIKREQILAAIQYIDKLEETNVLNLHDLNAVIKRMNTQPLPNPPPVNPPAVPPPANTTVVSVPVNPPAIPAQGIPPVVPVLVNPPKSSSTSDNYNVYVIPQETNFPIYLPRWQQMLENKQGGIFSFSQSAPMKADLEFTSAILKENNKNEQIPRHVCWRFLFNIEDEGNFQLVWHFSCKENTLLNSRFTSNDYLQFFFQYSCGNQKIRKYYESDGKYYKLKNFGQQAFDVESPVLNLASGNNEIMISFSLHPYMTFGWAFDGLTIDYELKKIQ